jgi:hypothetical protein
MTLPTLHGRPLQIWAALITLLTACSDSTAPAISTNSTAQFTITVRFVDSTPPPQSVLTSFNHAATKWRSAIVDSVGSIHVSLAAGACDSAQPAVNETVKDLLVLVHLRQIRDTVPGQTILGESGPCLIRKPGNLPILGVMSLNSSTLATLAVNGMLDDVITHEMAHLLGFGTVWDLDGLLRDTTTSNPWFSGSHAQAAFRKALPSYTDKIVPVEANGGTGTTLSHWRESVMTNELMTGFLNNEPNPLSAVTIESMADLGYVVNVGVADPWPTPSSRVSAAIAATPPSSLSGESGAGSPTHTALRRPRFWVDRSGELSPVPDH